MNFLNRSIQQAISLFQSMSVPARIVSGLLIIAIVVSLVYLFNYQIHSGDTYLYGGRDFSQSDLAGMAEALGDAGLNDFQIVGNRMRVPRSERAAYFQAIVEAGASPMLAADFDSDKSAPPLFENKQQQLNRQRKELQAKIAKLIEGIQGIERATVEFSETVMPGFPRRVERAALVSVKATGSRSLNSQEVETMRQIAAGAVAGLQHSQVTVVDENTSQSYRAPQDANSLLPQQNEYAQVKKYWEDYYRMKIEKQLHNYKPNVEVFVELDPTLRHIENAKQLDTTPIAVSQTEETKSETSTNQSPGGVPGVTAQNGGANGVATVSNLGSRESSLDETSSQSESVVGGTISQTTRAGLIEKSVSVSIGIPRTFYDKYWAQQNPPADGEEPTPMSDTDFADLEKATEEKIQEIVRGIIPRRLQGEDPYQYIVVETDPVIPEPPTVEPGVVDNAFVWLASNWQTIGLMLMGVFGLVMLRGMVKSASNAPIQPDAETDEVIDDEEVAVSAAEPDAKRGADGNGLKSRFGTSGRNLKVELTELVEEDVEAAANVLRTWIGDVE